MENNFRYSIEAALLAVAIFAIVGCNSTFEPDLSSTEIEYSSPKAERVVVDLVVDRTARFTWAGSNSILVAYGNSGPYLFEKPEEGPLYGEVMLDSGTFSELANFLPYEQSSDRFCSYGDLRTIGPNKALFHEGCANSINPDDEDFGYRFVVGIADTDAGIPPITLIAGQKLLKRAVALSERTQKLLVLEESDIEFGSSPVPVLYDLDIETTSPVISAGQKLDVPAGFWITDIDFSANGNTIVFAGAEDRRVVENPSPRDSLWMYEIETGRINTWAKKLYRINAVRWSPVKNMIAVSSNDGVAVFDFRTESWHLVERPTDPPFAITWSPDGKKLAVVSWAGVGQMNFDIYDLDNILSD